MSTPATGSARRTELLERAYAYTLEHGLADLSLRPLAAATAPPTRPPPRPPSMIVVSVSGRTSAVPPGTETMIKLTE